MFYIDEQTLQYLKLTGRDSQQVELVERYAKQTGLWASDLQEAEYERVLEFDLSSVTRNLAGPSNPHRRLPTSELTAKGIAGKWDDSEGRLPDGAVIVNHLYANTSNQKCCCCWACRKKANQLGLERKPWVSLFLLPVQKWLKSTLKKQGYCPKWRSWASE